MALSSLILLGCTDPNCRPGTEDGPWTVIGKEPPKVLDLKKSLVGMKVSDADELLGKPAQVLSDGAGTHRIWAFEKRSEAREITCSSPDKVKHYQEVLVVRSQTRDNTVVGCEIMIRGQLSDQVRDVTEIASAATTPFDRDQGTCQ